MGSRLRLFLDMGDLLTKGLAVQGDLERTLRFPSVIAHTLLDKQEANDTFLLDPDASIQRLEGFDPRHIHRTRSYRDAERVLERTHPEAGARFAGWVAAKYGADRRLLGTHPSDENATALLRKAIIGLDRAGFSCDAVELTLVIDSGPKASTLLELAKEERAHAIRVHRLKEAAPRVIRSLVRASVTDAPLCALAVCRDRVRPGPDRPTLLVDIGYLRTKVALLEAEGCAHQTVYEGLGVADCVRRVMRDEQERGLFEDELAVARALEGMDAEGRIAIREKRFDVRQSFERATYALSAELTRRLERTLLDDFARRGSPCRAVAIIGGGAHVVGDAIADRLLSLDLGLQSRSVAEDDGFCLVRGARALATDYGVSGSS